MSYYTESQNFLSNSLQDSNPSNFFQDDDMDDENDSHLKILYLKSSLKMFSTGGGHRRTIISSSGDTQTKIKRCELRTDKST